LWASTTGTLVYDANGATSGAAPSTSDVQAGPVTLDGNIGGLARNNYIWGGWSAVRNDATPITTVAVTASSTTTVYAIWTPVTYTLTYNVNGGTGTQVAQTSPYTNPVVPIVLNPLDASVQNSGFIFSGWYKPSGIKYTQYQVASGTPNGTAPETATVVSGGTTQGAVYASCAAGLSPNINYDWGTASSGFGNCTAVDDFLVHWTGYLNIPDSATATTSVTFSTVRDDGVLMSVGSNSVFTSSSWVLGNTGPKTATVTLNTNQSYPIDFWFWEHTGGAAVTLSWAFDGSPSTVISPSAFSTTSSTAAASFPGDPWELLGDTTIYAKWKAAAHIYTLTYNINGGSGTVPLPINGSGQVVLDDPTVSMVAPTAGWHFAGWNTQANGSGQSFGAGDVYELRGATTMYAIWAPNIYTLSYDANNGDVGNAPASTQGYGDVTVADNLYGLAQGTTGIFAGWNTKADGSGFDYLPGTAFKLDYDATLYAQYDTVVYTLTFDPNTAVGGSVTGNVPDPEVGVGTVILPGNTGALAAPGFNFTGWWNTKADGTGVTYSPGDGFILDKDTTLYANWVSNTVTLYTIAFNGNGSTSGVVPDPITGRGVIVLPYNTGSLLRIGYSFGGWTGWNSRPDGTGVSYFPGDYFDLNANITLYAVWNSVSYTLSYNNGGATGGAVPVTQSGYGNVIIPGNIGGLTNTSTPNFVGWTTDGGTTIYNDGDIFTLETDTVMTAVWTASALKHVYYHANEPSGKTSTGAVPDPAYTHGNVDLAPNINNLAIDGYNFTGWNTRADLTGNSYYPGDTVTVDAADIDMYAVWTPIVNTITYDTNTATSGTVPATWAGYGNTTIAGNSGNLALSGYTFGGWNDRFDGTGNTYSAGQTVNLRDGSLYLYAMWNAPSPAPSPTVIFITYNGNGSTGGLAPAIVGFYLGNPGITISGNTGSLVKTGFTFGGWSTTGTGTPLSGTFTPTTSTTLYAIWIPVVAPTPSPSATPTPSPTPTVKPTPSPTPSTTPSPSATTAPGKILTTVAPKQVVPNQIVPVKEVITIEAAASKVEYVKVDGKVVQVTSTDPAKIVLPVLVGPKDKVEVELVDGSGNRNLVPVVEQASNISIANVNFDLALHTLTPAAKKILDKVAAVVLAKGFTKITLIGHTDSLGSTTGYDNQTLSHDRAIESEKYLLAKLGTHKVTISVAAKAHIDPVASNESAAGRAANRRVEITVG
jgi:outer membrane protein OmpA-like peptidoglycan-associated protein